MTLRNYQTDLVSNIYKAWDCGKRRLMVQLATGGGKTVLFAEIVADFLKKNLNVLIIAHREELLWQAQRKVENASGFEAGIIKRGVKPNVEAKLQIASVQTITRRKNLPPADLLIVDEAHHATSQSYKKILEAYPSAKILGFTATPCRNDGQGFKYLFDALLCGLPTHKLIESGYLVPYKFYQAGKVINTKKIKTRGGDFRTSELSEAVKAQIEPADVVAEWSRRAKDKRTVVFAVDVASSITYTAAFKTAGVAAEHLDGETPNETRREVLQRFESGVTQVLCNCGIISEGFDLPGIEVVQIVRPTKSLSLWLQMIGRGLRIEEGKDCALIIDHSTSWQTLGLPDDDREWSLEPESLGKNNRFFATVCPKCRHIFKPLGREIACGFGICPNCQARVTLRAGISKQKPQPSPFSILPVGLEANTESLALDLTTNREQVRIIDSLICAVLTVENSAWRETVLNRFLSLTVHQGKEVSLGTFRYLVRELGYPVDLARTLWSRTQTRNAPDPEGHVFDLARVWEQVLREVKPLAQQILLRQHGRLISFDNNIAWVTLTSQSLLNMVKTVSLGNAFVAVFRCPLTVKLRVLNHTNLPNGGVCQVSPKSEPSTLELEAVIDW